MEGNNITTKPEKPILRIETLLCTDESLMVLDDAPAVPFSLGLHIKSLCMYTSDDDGNKIFSNSDSRVVKTLDLSGLGVYCNAR